MDGKIRLSQLSGYVGERVDVSTASGQTYVGQLRYNPRTGKYSVQRDIGKGRHTIVVGDNIILRSRVIADVL